MAELVRNTVLVCVCVCERERERERECGERGDAPTYRGTSLIRNTYPFGPGHSATGGPYGGGLGLTTRWSTTLSSEVNFPRAINFRT